MGAAYGRLSFCAEEMAVKHKIQICCKRCGCIHFIDAQIYGALPKERRGYGLDCYPATPWKRKGEAKRKTRTK
jgi:hypothetical protein